MTSVTIKSGTILPIENSVRQVETADEFKITINNLDPFHIECLFDNDKYRHKHVGSSEPRTALDIDCSWRKTDPAGSGIKVTIELSATVGGVEFIPQDSNGMHLGVTAGSIEAQKILCNLDVKPRTATFWIRKDPSVSNLQPYNLGFIFTDRMDPNVKTPIIYDPKVQNDS